LISQYNFIGKFITLCFQSTVPNRDKPKQRISRSSETYSMQHTLICRRGYW